MQENARQKKKAKKTKNYAKNSVEVVLSNKMELKKR